MPFSSIIGHRRVVDLLRQAVVRDRVPQSLLFAGPDGVGKMAVAIALAQAMNCPVRLSGRAADPADACGTCATCVRIAKRQHSDVAVVDRGDAASIKIEILRERVLEAVGYRPFEAAKRVFIVDDADAMTAQGQDALLKTLEEPPPSAVLILVTAYADTLLPTIQSRCRRLRFGPLSEPDVARVLIEHCRIAPAQAHVLAATSGGRVDVALAEDSGAVEDDREAALGLIQAAASRGPAVPARLKAAAALAHHEAKRRAREALGARLVLVQSLLRDMGALASGAHAELTHADLRGPLQDLIRSFDMPRLTAAFSAVTEAHAMLDRYASPKIVSDWLAISL